MKKYLGLYVVMFLMFQVWGQSNSDAQQWLDKVAQHYQGNNTFYLEFNSELSNQAKGTKDKYSGEVYVSKDKYNLSIPKLDVSQIYDGKKLYSISKEQKEVYISKPEEGELYSPTRVFDMYKSGYSFAWDKDKTVNGKKISFIKLTPNKSDDTQYVLVGIDKSKKTLEQLIEVTKKNTITTVTISKQLQGIVVPRSILKFDKKFYKDYYTEEL